VTEPAAPADAPDARARLVEAGIRCVTREGLAGASMAAIAQEARVSKALLHYHYHDRATLLAEIAERIGERIVQRERSALASRGATAGLDALWRWLEGELRGGELTALAELSLARDGKVRAAARGAGTVRRRAAAHSVDRLFAELGLAPRMPAALLAEAVVAFTDGLAMEVSTASSHDPRMAFDIFWLALLGLTE
jgi:AcrR family transcriptional regulator